MQLCWTLSLLGVVTIFVASIASIVGTLPGLVWRQYKFPNLSNMPLASNNSPYSTVRTQNRYMNVEKSFLEWIASNKTAIEQTADFENMRCHKKLQMKHWCLRMSLHSDVYKTSESVDNWKSPPFKTSEPYHNILWKVKVYSKNYDNGNVSKQLGKTIFRLLANAFKVNGAKVCKKCDFLTISQNNLVFWTLANPFKINWVKVSKKCER